VIVYFAAPEIHNVRARTKPYNILFSFYDLEVSGIPFRR